MIGHRAQRSQPSQVDHEVDLTGSLQKVQSLLRVAAVTVWAMPRRHVAIAVARRRHLGRQLRRHPRRPGLASRPCCSPRCASAWSRSRSRSSRARACRSRYVVAVGVFLSAGQFGLLFARHGRRACPPGSRRSCCSCRPRSRRPRRAAARRAPAARAARRRRARAGRDRRSSPPAAASAVPLGALALTIGAACLAGASATSRRARRASPNPLGLLVWSSLVPPIPLLDALAADRARRGGRRSTRPACSRCSTSSSSRRWSASAPGRGCCGQHPASTVAPFTLLVPVVGIASRVAARSSEAPSAPELVGAAVVLGGLALTVGLTTPRRAREARASCALSRRVALAAAFVALTAAAPAQAAQHLPRRERPHAGATLGGGADRRGDRRGRPRLGHRHRLAVRPARAAPRRASRSSPRPRKADFPAADAGYHNYAEMTAEIDARRGRLPGARHARQRIGTSYEGRDDRGR